MEVGDIVEAVKPYQLVCGSGRYADAICVQVNPPILISRWGDMLWQATLYEGCVRVTGDKASEEEMKVANERLKSHLTD